MRETRLKNPDAVKRSEPTYGMTRRIKWGKWWEEGGGEKEGEIRSEMEIEEM